MTSYLVPCRNYRNLLFEFQTLCVFEPPFEGGLETMDDVHLGLIGKSVDFLLVLSKVFPIGVTAESLRAKKSNIGDFAPTVTLIQNFR